MALRNLVRLIRRARPRRLHHDLRGGAVGTENDWDANKAFPAYQPSFGLNPFCIFSND